MSKNEGSPEKRTQAVADETARLLSEAVIRFTDQALDSRLRPITTEVMQAAAEAKHVADRAEDVRNDLEKMNATFEAKLLPLVKAAHDAAAITQEAAGSVRSAASNFSSALEALRAGPPSLAQFLTEARETIVAIQSPSARVQEELLNLGGRVSNLEQAVRDTARRIILRLTVVGLGLAGGVAWLLLR